MTGARIEQLKTRANEYTCSRSSEREKTHREFVQKYTWRFARKESPKMETVSPGAGTVRVSSLRFSFFSANWVVWKLASAIGLQLDMRMRAR